jgi:hypothetical protein
MSLFFIFISTSKEAKFGADINHNLAKNYSDAVFALTITIHILKFGVVWGQALHPVDN